MTFVASEFLTVPEGSWVASEFPELRTRLDEGGGGGVVEKAVMVL